MTTLELESLRAEVAREVLNTDDEALLKKMLKLFARPTERKSKTFERIPGLAYTDEERRESIRRSLESARAGRVHSADEVKAMFGLR
jgi:hypothetical protein